MSILNSSSYLPANADEPEKGVPATTIILPRASIMCSFPLAPDKGLYRANITIINKLPIIPIAPVCKHVNIMMRKKMYDKSFQKRISNMNNEVNNYSLVGHGDDGEGGEGNYDDDSNNVEWWRR